MERTGNGGMEWAADVTGYWQHSCTQNTGCSMLQHLLRFPIPAYNQKWAKVQRPRESREAWWKLCQVTVRGYFVQIDQ